MLSRKERYILSYSDNNLVGYKLPDYMLSELSNYKKIINKLLEENYMRVSDIKESIAYLTIPDLKEILRTKKLKLTGRKSELLDRIFENFSDDELKGYVKDRRYILTELGAEELKNNPPEGYYDVPKLDTEALIKNIIQEDAPSSTNINKKWYQKSWGIGILLLCVFPVGAYLLWKYGEFNVKTKKILTGIFAVIFLIMMFSSGNDSQEPAKENVAQTEQQEPAPAQKEKKEIPPQVQSVMDSTNVDEAQAETIVSILQQCGANDFTITKSSNSNETYDISTNGKILALALAGNVIGNVTYDGQVLYNSKTNAVEHTISDIDASRQKAEEQSRQQTATQKQEVKPTVQSTGTAVRDETYVGSAQSNKFHYPGCRMAKKINEGNLITFSSREEAVNAGYIPCKVCHP